MKFCPTADENLSALYKVEKEKIMDLVFHHVMYLHSRVKILYLHLSGLLKASFSSSEIFAFLKGFLNIPDSRAL